VNAVVCTSKMAATAACKALVMFGQTVPLVRLTNGKKTNLRPSAVPMTRASGAKVYTRFPN
jgi:hypothetical protein